MRNVSQFRVLMVLLFTLVSSGCAHKKLVDAGEDYNRQGRYELAVEKYKKALELKPNDRETQQKLEIAREELDIWLDDLHNQADAAKQNGLDGRALLLYSKVAQLRRDSAALNHYKQLHQQLGDQSRYKIAINSPKGLGSNVGRSLDGVQVISRADKNQPNQFSVKIDSSAVSFKTRTSVREAIGEYVSGVETIANPDYLHLQDDIAAERDHIHSFTSEHEHYYSDLQDSRNRLSSLLKDREIAQLKMGNATPNSAEQRRWSREIDRLNGEISKADRHIASEQKNLDNLDHKIAKAKKLLSEYLNGLSYMPPTVERDVLSDYPYKVKEKTKTANAKLTARFSDGSVKSKTVLASDTDEGHEEHPTIDLEYNPIKLMSNKQLTRRLYVEAAKQSDDAISRHANDYRNSLRNEANQMPGVDEKLEAWVRYGLSGNDGVDNSTSRQMESQLRQEFGITGEFPINQLLNLFGR